MNGWSSQRGDDRWGDEPAWVYEITWEWEPQTPGQRYPGDPGRRKAVPTPVYEASQSPGAGVASRESASPGAPQSGRQSGPQPGPQSGPHSGPHSREERTYEPR